MRDRGARMGEGLNRGDADRVTIGSMDELTAFTSRRGFLRLIGLGGALVLLPSIAVSCGNEAITVDSAGSGETVIIDFSLGDAGILQYAFALEQLEADFYTRLVSGFTGSNLS